MTAIVEVLDRLYLGQYEETAAAGLRPTHVLSLDGSAPADLPAMLAITIRDLPAVNLYQHFGVGGSFIASGLDEGGIVLLHCNFSKESQGITVSVRVPVPP